MHVCYEDVMSRIAEPPTWWTNGFPRFGPFQPTAVDIYTRCVALVHTKCLCGFDFHEAVHVVGGEKQIEAFKARVAQGRIGMGDPPNACEYLSGRPCDGQSSTSREIRVLEFWERPDYPTDGLPEGESWESHLAFKRQPEFERDLYDHFLERWGMGDG